MTHQTQRLVTMANDIANFFHGAATPQEAVDSIAQHLGRYWEPRMRKAIIAHYQQHGGAGLSDLAMQAVAKLGAQTN